jgi:citrate/tricarballylate utilization protein
MHATESLREAERLMTICNACRYCEGLCAVFPAMEMRRTFTAGDLNYLANLCHQCGACYADCQYSPPHEFNVNIPSSLATLRNESYAQYAWPRAFSGAFSRNWLVTTLATIATITAFSVGFFLYVDSVALYSRHGDFYKVMSHQVMAGLFCIVSIYIILAFWFSLRAFWRDIHSGSSRVGPAFFHALTDALHLTYLQGGGGGCTSENERPSSARRVFHHFTFYGFLLCFAATAVGSIYHYFFGWRAPYALFSLPVVLGTIGGTGLLIGPAGLLALSQKRDPMLMDLSRQDMDTVFILILFFTSLTGLSLMIFRETAAMGALLALHLGVVLAFFVTLPYGKFVHGLYRFLALLKYAVERKNGAPRAVHGLIESEGIPLKHDL